jgi:AdoMet-dependent rRNA methyltransferase SPB1
MGKKTKSKARLDKYYHLSKEMGYRSRAAFKLIQLNKKFNFLSGATVLIDLCAAPGGWCQVAAKEMPISSIKIGIDLDPIKPIPGVTTFQCDITTEQCRHLIRKEIKHLKADVVLHDGAPNVGGQWAKDSYNQNELVLYSIKLATEFLKEGGWFISKVFRSVDYNALLYVMKQLFQKVEATKPLASRSQAAEIFVICQGYKNPSYIDPKLLDPKYALKQIDDEDTLKNNTINSLKAMFAKKKSRAGYNTDTLFIVKSFKEYIECSNPFKFLFETNKIKIETDDCKKYLNVVQKMPKDYLLYFDDLQVLGKKEMEELIIWRNKIRTKLNLSRKENNLEKEEKKEEDKKEKDVNEEMDEEIKKYEKQRKKRLEAQKKKQEKIELSNKKAFILQEDQPHDNDVENDDELYEYMQKNDIDIENLEEPKAEEEEEEDEEKDSKEINYSDLTEDDYIDMMNEDIEENKRLYQEEKEIKKRNKEKGEKKKKKGEIELVKNEADENDEILDNEEIEKEEENEGDDSALYDEEEEEDDNEENEEDKELPLDEEEIKNDIIINNPLRKAKKIEQGNKDISKNIKNKKPDDESEEEDNNLSYDTDEELNEEKKRY